MPGKLPAKAREPGAILPAAHRYRAACWRRAADARRRERSLQTGAAPLPIRPAPGAGAYRRDQRPGVAARSQSRCALPLYTRVLGRQHRSVRSCHVRRDGRGMSCADPCRGAPALMASRTLSERPRTVETGGASQFGTVPAPLVADGAKSSCRAPTVLYANKTPVRSVRPVPIGPDPATSSAGSRAHGHRCAGSTVRLC